MFDGTSFLAEQAVGNLVYCPHASGLNEAADFKAAVEDLARRDLRVIHRLYLISHAA